MNLMQLERTAWGLQLVSQGRMLRFGAFPRRCAPCNISRIDALCLYTKTGGFPRKPAAMVQNGAEWCIHKQVPEMHHGE